MKRVIFILALLMILVVPQVYAEDLTYPFGREISVIRPCFNNGTYCDASFECNLTTSYAVDGSIIVDNQAMTNKVSYHNKTIPVDNLTRLGYYQNIMMCSDGSVHGKETFSFEITGDGQQFQNFPIQILFIVLSFALIGVSYTTDRLRMFKFIGSIMLFVIGVVTLYPGYAGINWTTLLGKTIGFSLIGAGFIFMIEGSFSFDKQVEGYQQTNDGRFHG